MLRLVWPPIALVAWETGQQRSLFVCFLMWPNPGRCLDPVQSVHSPPRLSRESEELVRNTKQYLEQKYLNLRKNVAKRKGKIMPSRKTNATVKPF